METKVKATKVHELICEHKHKIDKQVVIMKIAAVTMIILMSVSTILF